VILFLFYSSPNIATHLNFAETLTLVVYQVVTVLSAMKMEMAVQSHMTGKVSHC
jgi:acetyl/propionyl-CoA carboxylase alpha subunit